MSLVFTADLAYPSYELERKKWTKLSSFPNFNFGSVLTPTSASRPSSIWGSEELAPCRQTLHLQ